ncbi:MAG TPA: DUF1269 domain-containing protein [Thermomicrobiales bacterium]|nr:DUF1269 domain-containing protein [Thermomicrobiales bacterium]
MASLTAWKFDNVTGADQVLEVLKGLQGQRLIEIQDGAVVRWEAGKKKPKTEQLTSTAGIGALGGAFWGMLFGLLFFVPFFGMAIGAGMGALMGKFTDYGIDNNFIKAVQDEVTPGTSALFLLSQSAAPDRVIEAVKNAGFHPTLISSNLTEEQEATLREDFGVEA